MRSPPNEGSLDAAISSEPFINICNALFRHHTTAHEEKKEVTQTRPTFSQVYPLLATQEKEDVTRVLPDRESLRHEPTHVLRQRKTSDLCSRKVRARLRSERHP
jgi:hypothetical protein